MDFSKFTDEDFDVKDWVNAAFDSQKEAGTAPDQYATTVVMKLQMFIQEVNNVIEETSQQTIQNLPRVLRDIEAVKQESLLLQEQMKVVKQDIQKVEQDTAASMQMLLDIDRIKSRLQATSQALKEADNWTTLSAGIEDVFQSGDIQAITTKLTGMQQSLEMLKDVPDYESRSTHLESLKDRLEAMLGPQVVAAFNSKSTEVALMYVNVFKDIKRLTEFNKYYHKCYKNQLVRTWKSILETNADDSLIDWLTEFYDNVLSLWHAQTKWCGQVFSDPLQLVVVTVTDTLNSLDPSVTSCLRAHLDQRTDRLTALIETKQVSQRFAKSLEGAIELSSQGALSLPYVRELAVAIYRPYRTYFKEYGLLEGKKLLQELETIPLDESEILDCIQVLEGSVGRLFNGANEARERCVQLTDGCGFCGLLKAVEEYLCSYCREFRRVLTNLREKCLSGSEEGDEWSLFQNSLRINNTCGELVLHLEELDDSLMADILHTVGKQGSSLCVPTSPRSPDRDSHSASSFKNYPALYLDEGDLDRLQNLVADLEGRLSSVLTESRSAVRDLSEMAHRLAYDIVFLVPQSQLRGLADSETWRSRSGSALMSDLPTFSLSPQEYVTQIGQYLMTLPQHLESYSAQENPAIFVALKYGNLPHTNQPETIEHVADIWLESVAMGTMHLYCTEILKIPRLTQHATQQLLTDLNYFTNVLDDLGLQPSETLNYLASLLKTKPSDLDQASEAIPEHLVNIVREMRSDQP